MKIFKVIYGIAFVCSIACLFFAYRDFQCGSNFPALIQLVIGVFSGIANFKALGED